MAVQQLTTAVGPIVAIPVSTNPMMKEMQRLPGKIISIYCIVGIGANQDNTIHREKNAAQFELLSNGVKVSMTLKTLKLITMLVPYSNISYIALEE